jgi:hypothetical protein
MPLPFPSPGLRPVPLVGVPSPGLSARGLGTAVSGRPKNKPLVTKNHYVAALHRVDSLVPDVLKEVHSKFMNNHEIPPNLRPTRMLPRPMLARQSRAISQGWASRHARGVI